MHTFAFYTNQTNVKKETLKATALWKANLALWFVQLEAQFALAGITADDTKFNHVISAIDSGILNSVCDIILKPPDADKYSTLKNRLIESHSECEASKIRALLQGLELGDQRPSQLARIKALAGDTVGDPLLKSLWLGRLPNNTQTILTVLKEDLAGLASVADKINDLANHSNINSVTPQTSDYRVAQLEKQVAQLMTLVGELTTTMRQSRSQSSNREIGPLKTDVVALATAFKNIKNLLMDLLLSHEFWHKNKKNVICLALSRIRNAQFLPPFLPNAAQTQASLCEFLKNSKKNDKRPVPWTDLTTEAFKKCKADIANAATWPW
ncbi:transposon Ty3-I Gag-Pol polyprotein [Trichonephila clavata]|uniref:Transposon Ty3-I Gag-Pol polyprotein n=1 Tax=Trichonephila clavata TaxID=2740835 RepID=A0A8X6GNA2_TRICU|nr:transposon Ty3-I Gag-Pol polyprotein [Trichonephila clavata]